MDIVHIFLTVFISSPFSLESPLSWIRADPEMEYLAEIHFNQPIQMWVRCSGSFSRNLTCICIL